MKISYLITAYGDYQHLRRLVETLNSDCVRFYIHIDRKSKLPGNLADFGNICFVDRINVWWGGFSHLAAIVALIKKALADDSDYYLLLSGADYPIRSNRLLYEYLERGKDHINIIKGFQSHKPESRMKYYHFDGYDRRTQNNLRSRCYRFLEATARRVGINKTCYPFAEIYHGSTWWALTRSCLEYICRYIDDNPNSLDFYRTCWCPEETFFQSIIGNSTFMQNVEPYLTYVNWDAEPAPGLISREHVLQFKGQKTFQDENYGLITPFFARKFNDHSTEIVDLIDRELR